MPARRQPGGLSWTSFGSRFAFRLGRAARWRLCALALALGLQGARAATLFEEGFEGPGYENAGWIEVGTPDPDYTAQALEGNQSLHLSEIQLIRRPFNFSNSFHFYFRAQWDRWDPYNNIIDWEDASTSTTASIYADNDKLLLLHGGSSALGQTHIEQHTLYHIWVDWAQGSGSNGTMQLFISSDGFKPLLPEARLTNGNGGAVDRIFIGPFSPGVDVIFDSFQVSDSPIGDSRDANHVPVITALPDQTIDQDTTLGPLAFSVSDVETEAGTLLVSGVTSNPGLVPTNGIALAGAGTNRTVTITPAPGATGEVTITLLVSDGRRSVSSRFLLTVNSTNAPPFLFTESFEGPGYENQGWIESVAPNPDFTDGALAGAESLHCTGGQLVRRPFRFANKFNLYFQVKWKVYDAFNSVVYWEDAATSVTASLYADFNRLLLIHGSTSALGTTTMLEGTTYHVWLEWTYGPGSTGTMQLFVSTNAVKPDLAEASIANGNGNPVDRIFVGPSSGGADVVFDRFLVSAKPIGSNPEPPVNQPPVISSIPNQVTREDTSTPPIPFTVGDPETPPSQLSLAVTSSDPAIVPNANYELGGTGTNRFLVMIPAPNVSGSVTIAVRVTDAAGASATNAFVLTVEPVIDPIVVIAPPRDTVGVTGRPAGLFVVASSDLPLRFRWEKAGVEIPSASENTLNFLSLQAGDAARYTVHLSNDDTSLNADVTLEVLSALPQPRLASIEHRGDEAVLTFTTVSGAAYRLEYKDTLAELEWTPLQTVDGTGWLIECTDAKVTIPSRVYRVWTD